MFVTINELAGVPGLPATQQGLRYSLKKSTGNAPELVRKRAGTKAFEYHIDCLPEQAREIVKASHYREVLKQSDCVPQKALPVRKVATTRTALQQLRDCPALLDREVSALTEQQKKIADARAALAMEVEKLRDSGLSRAGAVKYIAEASRSGSLPEHIQDAAYIANARKGSSRKGVGERSLQEWLTVYLTTKPGSERLAMLAPGHHKERSLDDIAWLPRFLSYWRSANGPNMRFCYRDFCRDWKAEYHDQPAMLSVMPSYDAICRAMKKLPKRERMRGRVSGGAARALEVYSRRDWSMMPVNGCWICDGKSLDMKVKHPINKTAFTPELTLVIDGRTRFVVGWSMSYSENVRGVSEAYRYGIQHHGKPLFVYTDNGSGQKNKTLDAETTGIFPRMGIEHMTGIPGNPQARGIIERLNGVIPYAIAQRVPTYNGRGADRDNLRRLMVAVDSAENAQSKGKALDSRQRRALEQVPEWDIVLDIIQEEVDRYNNSHEHSELPKYNGKHLTPAQYRSAVLATEGDDIEYLTEIELRDMFMPEVRRIVDRGWVLLNNNHYFSNALADLDSQEVLVRYDPRNAEEVLIHKTDGAFVCKALWNGNTRAAVPVTEVERQIKERAKRQVALLDKKKQKVIEQATPALELKPEFDISRFMPAEEEPRKKVHLFRSEYEFEEETNKAVNNR
ncbi:Mu transposase C-terminal domain-containing protein [Buttiauxella noackiae]|uniref:Mu transposase C-terminal domain-containing protein n=1 Tax=Buttiauxella noackiae TaxID=82992 RepID=UPI0028D7E8DD|nr:Mu transposase C-terminal domain-containing protein [Buttiauxella noackiae]